MKAHKKHLDFELNLVPFIDLLSTCICFLLITAVWLNVGTMNVKQAVGGQAAAETEKKPLLWVFLGENGDMTFEARESSLIPAAMRKFAVKAVAEGKVDSEKVAALVGQLRQKEPGLRTALIQPKAQTSYETIIDLMDQFKKSGLNDLGVVPL